MSETEELGALIDSIISYYPPKNILLFGSQARGTATAASDIDLCVLYDHLPKRNLEVLQDLYKTLFAIHGRAVDLVVYEASQFGERAHKKGSLEQVIQREGQVLYG